MPSDDTGTDSDRISSDRVTLEQALLGYDIRVDGDWMGAIKGAP